MANLNYNHVSLAGRLVEDPKLTVTPSGLSVCRITIAYNKPGRDNTEADFFSVEAWKDRAEHICRYYRKGSSIMVDGRLRTDRWVDKATGQKRTAVVIVATEVYFVDSKSEMPPPEQQSEPVPVQKPAPGMYATPGAREDIKEGT